ncbi:hypothetical protein NDN08_002410 [Rhodosorus marinus]|uniref:AMP-dependent synthetase/ligase domain-containing protein n=1 Tax=Rhodosorus marinus TaxID=101924 RepID=A0AAV8UWF0_9RHOD|nr:hypothetical protein NDN08_002410 [Rhodosorus marinus]
MADNNLHHQDSKKTEQVLLMRKKSAFINELSADEVEEIVRLHIVKDLPKSKYAAKPAISFTSAEGRKVVYSHIEVYKMIEDVAHTLRSNGVRPKTRVAMLFNNSVEAVVTFLAIEWVHAIAAPVNPELDVDQIKAAVENLRAALIITQHILPKARTDTDVYTKAAAVATSMELKLWSTARSTNHGVTLDAGGGPIGEPAWHGGASDYTLDDDEDAVLATAADVDLLVLPLTHRNICSAAKIFFQTYELHSSGATIWQKPIHAVHGILVLLTSFYSGDATVLHEIKEANPAPPTAGTTLRFIRLSGLFMDSKEIGSYEETIGVPILESYGLPECSGIASSNTLEHVKHGTLGQTCDGLDIAIFSTDPENREMLGPGEIGDIAVMGDNVTVGYLNDEMENKFGKILTFNREDEVEEWFATGDRGELDENGCLILHGTARDARKAEVEARRQSQLEEEERRMAALAAAEAAEAARLAAESDRERALDSELAAKQAARRQEDLENARKASEELAARQASAEIARETLPSATDIAAGVAVPAMAAGTWMVVSTLHGQELTLKDLENDKYHQEWMTITQFMGNDQPRTTSEDMKRVFVRRIESTDIPPPDTFKAKMGRTVRFNNVSFIYYYNDEEEQDAIEAVLQSIPDIDTAGAVSEAEEEVYCVIAMSEKDMMETRKTVEEEFLRKLAEEEEKLKTEGSVKLLEDRQRLKKIREQELSSLRAIHQRDIERKLDEAYIARKGHYDMLLEEEKQRQAAEYLKTLEADRKIREDEFALAFAYLEIRKADELKRGLILTEREVKTETLIDWEKENLAETEAALAEQTRMLEDHQTRLRDIEEENLAWKRKMYLHLDDTLSAMLIMHQKRSQTDKESYAKALSELQVLQSKQSPIQEKLLAVYPKEHVELRKRVEDGKARRAELEQEALVLREDAYRIASTPQFTEYNLEAIEKVLLEANAAGDDSAALKAQTRGLHSGAEKAHDNTKSLAVAAAGASTLAVASATMATQMKEDAGARAPAPTETVYRAAGLDLDDFDDPDVVTKEIMIDLDEVEDAMVMHPAVEDCIAYTVDNPKGGVDIHSRVVLAKGARCSEEWLRLHAQTKLPAALVPTGYAAVSSIPHGASRADAASLASRGVDFVPSKDPVRLSKGNNRISLVLRMYGSDGLDLDHFDFSQLVISRAKV